MTFRNLLFTTGITLLIVAFAFAAPDPGYHLLKTIALTGDGGQDYLAIDPSARRLYVTHGTQVEVIDLDSEQLVGKIEGMNGVHGVALAPKLGHGFITSGITKTVKMFDLHMDIKGKWQRRFSFIHAVNCDAVTAELSEGVLAITIPKTHQGAPRRVDVR